MSKNLAKFLDQPERLVTKAIGKLEALNGYPGEDARLLAENSQAVRTKIADLGLDPDDTTGEELYHALLAKFEHDNELIDKAVGLNPDSNLDQRTDKASGLVEHMTEAKETWFIKHTVAKNLLREQPPRKLMKQLNYRSVDSLLKREDINSIYLMLADGESSSWQKTFAKKTAKLTGTDYELRQPQFAQLSTKFKTSASPTVSNSLIGAVGISASEKIQKAGVLTLALLLTDGLEELTHSESAGSVAHLNPALLWWEQAKSLMAACGEDALSLNLKDVAINHLEQKTYQQRLATHGRKSLWNELADRYENQVAQVEETVTNLERPKNLAVEYAEAVANEF